jgi:oligopeptidase A
MPDPSDTSDTRGTNPLLEITFAIPFDRIRAEHVEPAAKALLDDARAQLKRIGAISGPRTFENTLAPLDAATERLDTAMTVVSHLESVMSTSDLRNAYNAVQPEVSAFYASIPLDADLWRALKAYAETDDAKALTGTKRRYLERTLDSFRRRGADLDDGGKKRLEAITRELSELTTKYSQNVVDATAAFELYIDDEANLKGLPDSAKDAARQSADSKKKPGWRFTLFAPSMIPLLTYLEDRKIRESVYRAYNSRATEGAIDNRPLITRILELRNEEASLLGFSDFADFVLHDRMAKTGEHARAFVEDLTEKTRAAFARENERLHEFRREIEGDGAPRIEPWDVGYYAEKQRRALYDFDEEELRPYFSVDRVLEGLFQTAHRLYGIKIKPTDALPTWHPSVRAFDIHDEDGTRLGSFYSDLFPREEKRGGAWMNGLITGMLDAGASSPHLGLISANVTPPIGDKPALLVHDEVETLFHEFGHLLHHSLSKVEVRTLAGTNVAWDFVELPSQIMENWCWERSALDLFAHHHETNRSIPADLFEKMQRARKYRSANAMMRQLGFAAVDLALHIDYAAKDGDVVDYARTLMQHYAPAPYPNDYAFIASFNHLFASEVGYAAGYYSYKWAEVLDADAFTRFMKEGVFSRIVGEDFRRKILERGNGADPMELYKGFMGREPLLDPLLDRLGLLEPKEQKSVFNNPDAVREQLQLPAVVFYSFVGESSDRYHQRLDEIIQRIVGEENIRGRTRHPSAKGKYTAYRFEIFHERFDDVEAIYREVGALPGTRFVL